MPCSLTHTNDTLKANMYVVNRTKFNKDVFINLKAIQLTCLYLLLRALSVFLTHMKPMEMSLLSLPLHLV